MFRTVLVPTDGSPLTDKAVDAAIGFAKDVGGRIVAIAVAEPYPFSPLSETAFTDERVQYEEKAREIAQQHLQKVAAAAEAQNVPCETVVAQSFSPADEIVGAAARFGCDAVFMASHGRRGLSKLFLGSETQKVLANSAIPVMVFR